MPSVISPAWTAPPQMLSKGRVTQKDLITKEALNINSPLLFEMFKNISKDEKQIILDISQANGSSLNYFADYWCKLYLTNTINYFYSLEGSSISTPHKWHRALVKTMGFYKNDKIDIDVILLWGLPNYLNAEQLQGLISYLLPQCSKKVQLHTYIFNSELMLMKPANYSIYKNKVIINQQQLTEEITCPMYNLSDLQKNLSPFKLDHSVMLSSGIQEYVFRL